MMKRIILLTTSLVAALMLAACNAAPKPVALTSTFDAGAADAALKKGSNEIDGQAFVRQQGGGIVTCAGSTTTLEAVTSYTTERMQVLYGRTDSGFRNVEDGQGLPPSQELAEHSRHGVCDAQGNFSFSGVADGDYYVATTAVWKVGDYMQGGALMQEVSVHGGETRKVILSR